MNSPIPTWDHQVEDQSWSFATDCVAGAVMHDPIGSYWLYEYGTLTEVRYFGLAASKDEAFRKVHVAYAEDMPK